MLATVIINYIGEHAERKLIFEIEKDPIVNLLTKIILNAVSLKYLLKANNRSLFIFSDCGPKYGNEKYKVLTVCGPVTTGDNCLSRKLLVCLSMKLEQNPFDLKKFLR
jgi:hypothetical protein